MEFVLESFIIIPRLLWMILCFYLIRKGVIKIIASKTEKQKHYKAKGILCCVVSFLILYSMFILGNRTFPRVEKDNIPQAFDSFFECDEFNSGCNIVSKKDIGTEDNIIANVTVIKDITKTSFSLNNYYDKNLFEQCLDFYNIPNAEIFEKTGTVDEIGYNFSSLWSDRTTFLLPYEYSGHITLQKGNQVVSISYEYNHFILFNLFQPITNIDFFIREKIDLEDVATEFNNIDDSFYISTE